MPKKARKRLTNPKNYNRELARKRAARKADVSSTADEDVYRVGNVNNAEVSEEPSNPPLVPLSTLICQLKESLKEGSNAGRRIKYRATQSVTHQIQEPIVVAELGPVMKEKQLLQCCHKTGNQGKVRKNNMGKPEKEEFVGQSQTKHANCLFLN